MRGHGLNPGRPFLARAMLFSLAFALPAACGGGTDIPLPPACAGSENLLENPSFGAESGGGLAPWRASQHAGEPSFEVTVDGGTVTVERVGPEPWYTLTQSVQVRELAGHELLFRADLRLDLNAEGWTEAMEPGGGMQVVVWANSERPRGGDRIVYRGSLEQEPSLGQADWFKAAVPIELPERATRLRIGFVHQANGSLSLRDPELFDCGVPSDEKGTP